MHTTKNQEMIKHEVNVIMLEITAGSMQVNQRRSHAMRARGD